jgi:hypothetical protein
MVKLIEIITAVFQAECTFPLSFFFTSRLEEHIVSGFAEPTTNHLALEDFIQGEETEEEKIARLSPHELVSCMRKNSFFCSLGLISSFSQVESWVSVCVSNTVLLLNIDGL